MTSNIKKQRGVNKPKNRQTKTHLIFDEKARKEYLTGFSKRKAERRKKFNEKLKKEIKTERKRLQSELREDIKKSASNRAIPGLENLVETATHVFELPEHTVTIEPIVDASLNSELLYLGKNEGQSKSSEEDKLTMAEKKKKIKEINRQMNKRLKKTKAFKQQTQMVRDKSRKKSSKKSSKNKKK